ncbi:MULTISPECIES: hypothetical protein [unclassified Robiginitalea]|uniref:hypothetical protein n=1 Tax=Robiginitalea TaxID=252306 RepID=UPI002349EFC8|nr:MULTISPECIES: hypothetical protein [unclassified Robiginitalea]MDC6352948.1 hypothetical protein [Robiginitalea sp. PM2]MDC6373885.1 hypothetical protein [Robiginitalea sp. SP8]
MTNLIGGRPVLGAMLAGMLLLAGCKGEKKQEAKDAPSQMEEVIAVHDEVMPEMKTIANLVAELKPLADSTGSDSQYAVAMQDLQAAHQSMMDWMQGFGNRFDHEEIMKGKALSEEKQAWLAEEQEKVEAMRNQVLGSIERAREVLEEAREGADRE